jgi:preprotein translocase subunit SecD
MPTNYTGRIITIIVVVLAALWAIFPSPLNLFRSDLSWGQKIALKPGIDMQGGTSLLYEIKPPEGTTVQSSTAATSTGLANEVMAALKKRIDPEGVRNLVWRPHGETKLEIQMPATPESQAADALGQELAKARGALEKTNLTPGEVIAVIEHSPDAAARDKRLAELAAGSKEREGLFKELATAWDKLQQARKDQNAEAAADAQVAYTAAQAKIGSTNLRASDFEEVLKLTGTQREQRLAELRKAAEGFPARKSAIDQYVAAYEAFSKVSNQINDVAELKQKLRGAGVLEFHILAGDAMPEKILEMQRRLQSEGPRSRAGDELKWVQVAPAEEGKIRGPTGQYNGKV